MSLSSARSAKLTRLLIVNWYDSENRADFRMMPRQSPPANLADPEGPLAAFDARNNHEGLLRRYARGRIKHIWSRLILTLIGAASLAFLASPLLAIVVLLVALFGETVDCLLLYRLPEMLGRNKSLSRLTVLTAFSAGLQAVTVAFCVVAAWTSTADGAAIYFAMSFLVAASINAGILMPYHRTAAFARLAVFAILIFGLLLYERSHFRSELDGHFFFIVLGVLVMAYLVVFFIIFANRTAHKNANSKRALIKRQVEIDQVNQALRASERETHQLAIVAQQARDTVVICNADGQITWVNQAFTKSTGYSFQEAVGRSPDTLLEGPGTDKSASAKIREAAKNGQPHRAEILNYTKSKRKFWVETNIVPVFDARGDKEMTIAIERDITEAKQNADDLAQAKLVAENSERAKAGFLANMSHEIRTPMNGIIGMSDLLCGSDNPIEQKEYADIIRSSASALLTIINDILDFSKLEAGKLEISPKDFSIYDCVSGVAELLRHQANVKGLEFNLSFGSDFPRFMHGDDGRIRQILINLVANAIKFTEIGSVKIHASHVTEGGINKVTITIQDTGVGISSYDLLHIFDEFSQANATTSRRFGGTGLGLTISRLLAQKLGGDISATSQPGVGSCFTLTLTLAQTHGTIAFPKKTLSEPGNSVVAGLKVLVVEDNRTNRLLMQKLLGKFPIALDFACDGFEAVDHTISSPPDLIFMDMSMPGMDGLEATRAIRATDIPQPVIIALTANAFDTDRSACLDAGMDDFLTKPIRRKDLLEMLTHPRL